MKKEPTIWEKFDKLIDSLPERVGETPREVIKDFLKGELRKEIGEIRKLGVGLMPLENEALIKNVHSNLRHNEEEYKKIGYNRALSDLTGKLRL